MAWRDVSRCGASPGGWDEHRRRCRGRSPATAAAAAIERWRRIGWRGRGRAGRSRLSAETIYRSLFVQARGNLRHELTRHLRTGRAMRRPKGTGLPDGRGVRRTS